MKQQIFYFCLITLISSCESEEIKGRNAEGWASFSESKLEFFDVEFVYSKKDTINLRLNYYERNKGIFYDINILNIPTTSDSIQLVYYEGSPAKTNLSIAYFYIQPSEDTLGEHYVIDSIGNSYLILESVSSSRITGRINFDFMLPDESLLPKHAPYIPDRFSITEGSF